MVYISLPVVLCVQHTAKWRPRFAARNRAVWGAQTDGSGDGGGSGHSTAPA